ncbi:unnamed protein product [Bursaphelenchus okinawaensis]|uniref:RNA polymerase II-associated protein 3 n=1 Tax=Bursaphelenchus okinawaensis TaxID=465554 RepID=A0A811KB21_9BILA|nr:unnamed protein product [Bursaphelenchus okinawaensis]CAG9100632.1 unnamed protein product [Bursaphelenchus okinawaensis]
MSKEAEALKLQGNEHFKQKKFNNALKSYSKAIEFEVTPVILANRSQAYLKMQSYEKALSDATEALNLDPKYGKALYRRAWAAEKLKLYGWAKEDVNRLLDIDPMNRDVVQMWERIGNQVNEPQLQIKTFTKSEAVQSKTTLKEVQIKLFNGKDVNLDKINLNMAAINVDENKETESVKIDADDHDKDCELLPEPPQTPSDFYSVFVDMKHDCKTFAKYFLTIDLFKYEAIFGGVLDFETLILLCRGLREAALVGDYVLERLMALTKVSRFDLCILMAADDIRTDLENHLSSYPASSADVVQQVKRAFLCC